MNWKTKYMLVSMRKCILRQGFSCPSCGSNSSKQIDRKYMVTSLRQCSNCKLQFRTPTTTPEENAEFYQDAYQEKYTTDMPDQKSLDDLTSKSFQGTPKDFSRHIEILKMLDIPNNGQVCDFGCSWGYGSWQFSQAGYRVQSFEISNKRANFARTKLGVNVVSSINELTGPFDVFFSSHVLEHVPSVQKIIDTGLKLLNPNGYFIAFTPNGSIARKMQDSGAWKRAWGMKHPNHMDDVFYRKTFESENYYISTSPYNMAEFKQWSQVPSQYTGKTEGGELMIIARKQ